MSYHKNTVFLCEFLYTDRYIARVEINVSYKSKSTDFKLTYFFDNFDIAYDLHAVCRVHILFYR